MKKRTTLTIFTLLFAGLMLTFFVGCEKNSNDNKNNDTIDTIHHDTSANLVIPAGWSKVGDLNANDMIWSITSDGSGNVYAGGYFTNGSGYNYVARWNGTKWDDIGLNANSSIYALTTDATGNVYAVGNFTNGATSNGGSKYVARWNGSSWSDIGVSHNDLILSADDAGNVYNGTSKWNGSAWFNLNPLNPPVMGVVYSLATSPSGGTQYAGGSFGLSSGYRYVARYNGAAWNNLGNLNANADIHAIVADNNGNVYAAGSFTNGNLPTTGYKYVAKWDGTGWSEPGHLNANDMIYSLAVDNNTGYVYASGYFTNTEGAYVAKWDGTSWTSLGNMSLSPTPIYVSPAGKLYSVVASHDGKIFCVVVHD
jgi:hypothetical protein